MSRNVSRFYHAHFSQKDMNVTLDNVLSYENTQKKLQEIFQKFEELSGKKTQASIIVEDEDSPVKQKKGHLFENVNKLVKKPN